MAEVDKRMMGELYIYKFWQCSRTGTHPSTPCNLICLENLQNIYFLRCHELGSGLGYSAGLQFQFINCYLKNILKVRKLRTSAAQHHGQFIRSRTYLARVSDILFEIAKANALTGGLTRCFCISGRCSTTEIPVYLVIWNDEGTYWLGSNENVQKRNRGKIYLWLLLKPAFRSWWDSEMV